MFKLPRGDGQVYSIFCKIVFEKNENKQKEAGYMAQFKRRKRMFKLYRY